MSLLSLDISIYTTNFDNTVDILIILNKTSTNVDMAQAI